MRRLGGLPSAPEVCWRMPTRPRAGCTGASPVELYVLGRPLRAKPCCMGCCAPWTAGAEGHRPRADLRAAPAGLNQNVGQDPVLRHDPAERGPPDSPAGPAARRCFSGPHTRRWTTRRCTRSAVGWSTAARMAGGRSTPRMDGCTPSPPPKDRVDITLCLGFGGDAGGRFGGWSAKGGAGWVPLVGTMVGRR
jgi:hypothetical protein